MSGTDATGIPARDGDGNAIPPPIAPAPVNPVAPPAPLAQDVSDTVILTAIGTLTSALGEMAPAPRTPGTPNAAPRVDFFRNTVLEEGDDSQTQLVKILTSLHNVSFSQLLIQESMMRGLRPSVGTGFVSLLRFSPRPEWLSCACAFHFLASPLFHWDVHVLTFC